MADRAREIDQADEEEEHQPEELRGQALELAESEGGGGGDQRAADEVRGNSFENPPYVLFMASLSRDARVAGALYIVASLVGIVRLLYIPKTLIVRGDAAATAANIAAHEWLFRWGIVSYLVAGVIWLFVPLALYRLLKDVDRTLAIVMVILGSFMQTPMYIVNTATDAAALLFVKSDLPQRETFAMLSLRLHHHLDVANAIFAGVWLIPFGLLVYRSRFLPRFLGVWLMVGCLGWLAFCFAGLLYPGTEGKVFDYVQPLTLGEVVVMFWLLIGGARTPAET